jgi:transcriptional regulator with XRE-family HTH domain
MHCISFSKFLCTIPVFRTHLFCPRLLTFLPTHARLLAQIGETHFCSCKLVQLACMPNHYQALDSHAILNRDIRLSECQRSRDEGQRQEHMAETHIQQAAKTRLQQEKEQRDLSLDNLAEIAGVLDVSTVSRWVNGFTTPSREPRKKLCDYFGLSAKEFGWKGDRTLPQDAAFKKDAQDPLTRLAGLIDQPQSPYDEVYLNLTQLSKQIMIDPTRRIILQGALALLTAIPTEGIQRSWQWEPILQRCTVAVAACQELSSSSNGADLFLAFNKVSNYIPLLTRIARESSKLHGQALDLAARCAILKTTLGWHCADNTLTIGYAQNAVELGKEASQASGDPSLWLSASSKLAWAYSLEDEHEDALKIARAAEQLLLEQDPERVPFCIYGGTQSTLARMQALAEQDPTDALLIAASQDPGDRAIALMEFTRADVLCEVGWTYYHARKYALARKELEKIIDPSTLVTKMPQSERMRLSALKAMALASLKMPDRDMEEIIRLWMALVEGAKALDSKIQKNGTWRLYNEITIAFPGNKDIEELRTQLPRRKKKAPDA